MTDLLTAEQVAEKLQVHVKTVYANRDIPRVVFGGSVRWREADIDLYLQTKITRKPAPRKRVMRQNRNVVEINRLTRKDDEAS